MSLEVDIDSRVFDQAINDLVRLTGRSQADVIKSEARAILGKSVQRTKKGDKRLIRGRYTYKGDGDDAPDIVTPFVRINGVKHRTRSILKKGMWEVTRKGVRRWNPRKINPLYRQLQEVFRQKLAYKMDQVGQSKATFLYLAEKLRLTNPSTEKEKLGGVRIPAYVRKALRAMPNDLKQVLTATDHGRINYYVQIKHDGDAALTPTSKNGAGGKFAFMSAFRGREAYYKRNIDNGVFNSTKQILKRYPDLKVTQTN